MLRLRKPPLLWPPRGLSEEETDAIKWLNASMHGLLASADAWAAALELFHFGKARPPQVRSDVARRWQWIAIHECAMQIAYLRERIDIIRGRLVKASPIVQQHIDKGAMRRAVKLFDEYFPNHLAIRHAIAHSGEVDLSPERHAPAGTIYALTRINEADRLELTFEGATHTLDITNATLLKIQEIVSTFWDAFAPAAKVLEEMDPEGAD